MRRLLTGLLVAASLACAAEDEHLRAARDAEARGDFAAAEREYQQRLAVREDAEILQRLGLVRHLQNKFSEAIPALERAVRLRPDLWGAQLFLGIDYYRMNRFDDAQAALTKVLALKPGNPEARFWLGATRIARKEFLSGLEILEQLLREQPDNLELLRLLAQTYSDFATAIHNRLALRHPESAWAYLVHGQALEYDGFPEAALEQYRTALKIRPHLPEAEEAIRRLANGRLGQRD